MMRTRTNLILTLAMAGALSLTGCKAIVRALAKKGVESATADGGTKLGGTTGTTGTSPITADDPETQLIRKVDPLVVKCLNTFSSRVRDSERRYFSWVDMKTGLTGKERTVYGLYQISGNPKDCLDAVTKSNALAPKNPSLEGAATEYAAALGAALPIINDAYKYYDRAKHKDDAFAQGKDFHPKLKEAFERFRNADNKLSDEVDKLQDVIDKAKLAKYEHHYGKDSYPFLTRETLMFAKEVVKLGDRPIERLDLSRYEDRVKKLEESTDDLEKFMTTKGEATSFSAMHTYMEKNQSLVKAAKEQIRRTKEKKPFSAMEARWIQTGSGWMVEGSASKMVKQFNDMIDQYNRLQKDSKFQAAFKVVKPGTENDKDDDDD